MSKEAVLLVGMQASGKTSFYRERFCDTHVRISLDMLRTRHREAQFFDVCLRTGQSFVVDNTNPTMADRKRYIAPAKNAGFRIVGYYFRSSIEECMRRNGRRSTEKIVPDRGLLGTYARLAVPTYEEGFDALYYVRMSVGAGFSIAEWSHEV